MATPVEKSGNPNPPRDLFSNPTGGAEKEPLRQGEISPREKGELAGKELIIVDTFPFFFRNFYALPPLRSPDGFPTGMLQGLVNFIHKLPEIGGNYIVFALDSDKGKNFRKSLYPQYKENRPAPPEDLKLQIQKGIELLKGMGFKLIEIPGFESDDVIASLVEWGKEMGFGKIKILSTDKDLCQLIENDRVILYDFFKNIEIDREGCFKKFGVYPEQFRDYLSLVGDSIDNIPGVKGIGPKRARELLEKYGTLEQIYNHLEELPAGISKKLEEGRESAFLSRELVQLRRDLFQLDQESGELNRKSEFEKE
ncbi:MAG: 5'-3' exonuclease H3TH domain-containing protein [Campylobacterales bacterium]